MDILLAGTVFLCLSPVLVLVMLLIVAVSGKNPFFVQVRPGKRGKPFRIIKLKTMLDLRDGNGVLLPDERRLTPLGKFIRKTSLDELPQLLNVVRGEMSLIGPRPLLMEYLELYNDFQARRHEVRPGITGWAQVNGRNAIGWDERFALDVWYVDHLSAGLDLRIVWMTVWKVGSSKGVNQQGQATVAYFRGNGHKQEVL
ncbi:sugar transferase [Dinghuibacter silviterrae]|nr:sugar transferase [Dinghuibacter silviterrae]